MTWHTETVPAEALKLLLARIGQLGGTVTHSFPSTNGVCVTWSAPEPVPAGAAPTRS